MNIGAIGGVISGGMSMSRSRRRQGGYYSGNNGEDPKNPKDRPRYVLRAIFIIILIMAAIVIANS